MLGQSYTPEEATLTAVVELVDRALRQKDNLHTFIIGRAFGRPGAANGPNVRERFIRALEEQQPHIRVHYPEGLFDELILSERLDLINLENILADSVDAVVICVESNGSIAELGAFAANPRLAPKLLIIADRTSRATKSFINLGPIRHLRVEEDAKVIWHPFDSDPKPNQIQQIADFVRNRREEQALAKNWHSPIRLEILIHFLVMIYQPIAEHELLEVINHIARLDDPALPDSNLIRPIGRAVIQKLSKDGWIRRELRARPTFKQLQMNEKDKVITYPTHLSSGHEWHVILKRYSYSEFVPDIERRLVEFRVQALNAMFRRKR